MVITTKAEDVLAEFARLATTLCHPAPLVASYHRRFMGSEVSRDAARAQGMFYPVKVETGRVPSQEDGVRLSQALGNSLRDAVPYQVTSEMIAVMRSVYENTLAQVEHVNEADLPCASGMAWLDDGWTMRDMLGKAYVIRALSWRHEGPIRTKGTEDAPFTGVRPLPCVRITMWCHVADDMGAQTLKYVDAEDFRQDMGTPMSLMHTALIPFGLRFAPVADRVAVGAESVLGLVHVLWMFLGMEITAERRVAVSPKSRRKRNALKSVRHHEVHVVLLRRVRHDTDPEGTTRDVDWSCRWVVQGHYRHDHAPRGEHVHRAVEGEVDRDGTRHCAVCGDRLFYVRPHVKGPDGKPLRVSRVLHKLAR